MPFGGMRNTPTPQGYPARAGCTVHVPRTYPCIRTHTYTCVHVHDQPHSARCDHGPVVYTNPTQYVCNTSHTYSRNTRIRMHVCSYSPIGALNTGLDLASIVVCTSWANRSGPLGYSCYWSMPQRTRQRHAAPELSRPLPPDTPSDVTPCHLTPTQIIFALTVRQTESASVSDSVSG